MYVHSYNIHGITFKISQLIVGHIQRFVLGRKVTLRTFFTYDPHLRTLERRPVTESYSLKITIKQWKIVEKIYDKWNYDIMIPNFKITMVNY